MRLLPLLLLLAAAAPAAEPTADDYRADARSIAPMIQQTYAYLDRFAGGTPPRSAKLDAEAEQVHDRRSLLLYAERALLALADHHAITGASTAHDWAIVPSYADLWIERRGGAYLVEAVRDGSPAAAAGIARGDRLTGVGGVPTEAAVQAFWGDLGLPVTQERASFAARILAAGRRDSPRRLEVGRGSAPPRTLELPNLYQLPHPPRPPVTTTREGAALVLRFNDSLGDDSTIAAFDSAMANARRPVILDLTDTPSGGNTVVARAVLGWFVARATGYQVHNLPAEERSTGIPRQWVEEVLPRPGKRHARPAAVRVGRWTGSMGEGLAIGFSALGVPVVGDPMAGLRGAVYDERLDRSGLVLKLPAERLYTVAGLPRERFAPIPERSPRSRRSRPANP